MKVKLNGNDWYRVTSDFGNQHPAHSGEYHTGIDLSMPSGTEIHSPVEGIVEKIIDSGDKGLGRGIYIRTEDGEQLILGHLSEFKVQEGQEVGFGDLIALSGNTGNSTGAHLHIGLKGEDGFFIDPSKFMIEENTVPIDLLNSIPKEQQGIITKLLNNNKSGEEVKITNDGNEIIKEVKDEGGMFDGLNSFMGFMREWKNEGLFHAIYGKSFFEVVKDFFKELFRDIGIFILGNADIFFLAPAILFMFGTFIVGKNRFTKWIIPLWFFYFIASFFHKMLLA